MTKPLDVAESGRNGTSIMSLWTPGGEVPVNRDQGQQPEPDTAQYDDGMAGFVGGPNLDDLSPDERAQAEAMIQQMAEVQRQILSAPAAQLVANHIIGFYELAMIHLAQEKPILSEAKLAIDAMAATLDAVADRLGENAQTLVEALTQAQMAYLERAEGGG